MKKYLIILFILLFPIFSVSSLDLGLGVDFYFHNETVIRDGAEANYIKFILEPTVILKIQESMELDLSLYVSLAIWRDPIGISATIVEEHEQYAIGIGGTLFFNILRSKYLDLSVGPKAEVIFSLFQTGHQESPTAMFIHYDFYLENWLQIFAPIALDFKIRKTIFLRIKYEIPIFILNIINSEISGSTATDFNIDFLDFVQIDLGSIPLYLGFYFML